MATALGAIAALAWPVAAAMCAIWLVVAAATRYASLASMTAAAGAPVAALWLAPHPANPGILAVIAALLLWRHRGNIKRLADGTESRIGQRAARSPGQPPGGPSSSSAQRARAPNRRGSAAPWTSRRHPA